MLQFWAKGCILSLASRPRNEKTSYIHFMSIPIYNMVDIGLIKLRYRTIVFTFKIPNGFCNVDMMPHIKIIYNQ